MIDWTRIRDLKHEVGNDDFSEIVDLFFDEVRETLEDIKCAPPEANLEASFHFLKGSAINLGFATFSSLCENAEMATKQGTDIEGLLPAIISSFAQSYDEFTANLSKL